MPAGSAAIVAAAWFLSMQAPQAASSPQTPPSPSAPRVAFDGYVGLLADFLPRMDAVEFRPSVLFDLSTAVRGVKLQAEAAVEGLAARRGETVTHAAARARDIWAEVASGPVEVRAGYGRVIWGRLDEIQPSDVINPIDAARFLLDGRSEARLPVGFVRTRVFAGESVTFEGVFVPFFRRGWFDQRDEPTSPFNLINDAVLPAGVALAHDDPRQEEPAATWSNVSGGGRVSATIGRVDVAGGIYRGFDAFGPITLELTGPPSPGPPPSVPGELVEWHPRFTMVSGDFETVQGDWAMRGEVAMFPERTFAGAGRGGLVNGRSIDAGAGVERRAGDYRLFASAILHREWSSEGVVPRSVENSRELENGTSPEFSTDRGTTPYRRTDVSLVGSVDRPFRRDTWLVRVFGVMNAVDRSGFLRGLLLWKPRDNVTWEFSAATFLGTGDDSIGRFKGRDFLFARLKYHF